MSKIETAVGTYLKTLLPEQTVNIGLSGGRDSIVLLHAVVDWFKAHHQDLSRVNAIHINHGISELADNWTAFCEQLCVSYGISCASHHVHVDMSAREGIEAAARDARYNIFKNAPSGVIVLAQHKNDQAETFLFNILRGCSVSSAGGMPTTRFLRADLVLHRPLLNVTRAEINDYAQKHNLEWVEDDSNTDTSYSRNFIRHDVLPLLNTKFPSIENRLVSTAERFNEAGELLDDLALADLGAYSSTFPLPVSLFSTLPERRARNVLRYVLNNHGLASPAPAQMSQAIHQFVTAKPDRKPEIKVGNMHLVRIKKMICLVPIE